MGREGLTRRQMIKGMGLGGAALLLEGIGPLRAPAAGKECSRLKGGAIRWIVPFSPGGGYDTYSRLIEPFYEKQLGAEINVENVTGASGLRGTRLIREAEPDGFTLGIINAPGLLAAIMLGKGETPNPARDFTILGRVVRTRQVVYASAGSPLKTMEDLFRAAQRRPILAAINEVGGTTFHNLAIPFHLLGIPLEFIAGYPGSRETSLAVMRGEADVSSSHFESILDRIEGGELRPILQITGERISHHPSLDGVPVLGGKEGLAARRAEETGGNVGESLELSAAFAGIDGAGRLVAAPPGLDEDLSRCLADGLHQVLTDPGFLEAAAGINRSLDPAPAAAALLGLEAANRNMEKLIPIIQAAIRNIRE